MSYVAYVLMCVFVPGLSVCDADLLAGSQGRKHHYCSAALPPEGQPGGTQTGKTACTSAGSMDYLMC